MSEPAPAADQPPAAPAPARPLDDVMIAMDVVDTLRHDARLVDRELNDEGRRAELIERLRKIYHGQGIEVPDELLEAGVKALEEKRFVYTPPADGLAVRLARLYVSRGTWGRWLLAAVGGLLLLWAGWYTAIERPRLASEAALQRELGIELPARIDGLLGQIAAEARLPAIKAEAEQTAREARQAIAAGRSGEARAAAGRLEALLGELRASYDVRVVSRAGEISGLWRIPKINQSQRNYYLVVEALDRTGHALEREIVNEETGERKRVTKWALRVPKAVFDAIQADKQDDGIIQKAAIGAKVPGELEPRWLVEVSGGALTEW